MSRISKILLIADADYISDVAIHGNVITLGLVDTPMTASWLDAQSLWKEKSPMQRGASPDDIAHIAAMIVSSNYLTGEVVLCDGGLNLT